MADAELPNKMSHLDLMEVDDPGTSNKTPAPEITRVLRKRKSLAPEKTNSNNRRVCMKPRKHINKNSNPKQIEALYLNKKVKAISQALETIYEEPKSHISDNETFIGGRKVKRLISFQLGNRYNQDKIKKRRAMIKKFLGNNTFLNRKKIPMPEFLKKIECLELDEALKTEIVSTTDEVPMVVA